MNQAARDRLDTLDIAGWIAFSRTDASRAAATAFSAQEKRLGSDQFAAIVAHRLEERELARKFDARARAAEKPLSGVPFYAKDLFDLAGIPTRAGSRFLERVRATPTVSSCLVRELEDLGAVCAGKTHLHEFAYGITGQNPHYGNVSHPQFSERTSGGSSSGSAALVGRGVVPFALGTDTGGSIRIPAAFCGLFGFRHLPGHRWIRDAFPLAPCFDTAGWLTRTATDLRRLNACLVGTAPTRKRRLAGCYLPWGNLEPEVAKACEKAASLLCEPADRETKHGLEQAFAGCGDCYSLLTSAEAAKVHEAWLDPHRAEYGDAVWHRLDRGRRWSPEAEGQALVRRQVLGATLSSYFLTYDYLVLPSVPCPAIPLQDCERYPRERLIEISAPASLAGLPALALPVPLGGGLTAGLQVLAPSPSSAAFERALELWESL